MQVKFKENVLYNELKRKLTQWVKNKDILIIIQKQQIKCSKLVNNFLKSKFYLLFIKKIFLKCITMLIFFIID